MASESLYVLRFKSGDYFVGTDDQIREGKNTWTPVVTEATVYLSKDDAERRVLMVASLAPVVLVPALLRNLL